MSTLGSPEDPTRALDGFSDMLNRLNATTRGRPSRLSARLALPTRGVSDSGGQAPDALDLLDIPRSREAMHQDFVDTTPRLDLWEPPARNGQTVTAALDEATARVRTEAAAQWLADARAAEPPPSQLDLLPALRGTPRDPRLLEAWQAGAWIAASKPLLEANTEIVNTPRGPAIEAYPPQRLVALWSSSRTDGPHLGRWPWRTFLAAAEPQALDDAVLGQVPGGAPMWWLPPHLDLVDWALIAEIVLIHSASLRPFQIEALKTLIDEERTNAFSQANSDYQQTGHHRPVQRRY